MPIQDVLYYLIWAGLFFLMMRYGCGAHIMGHHNHRDPHVPIERPPASVLLPDTGRAKDLVCGMQVEASTAKTAAFKSQIYYFCSHNCREKFETSPGLYTKLERAVSIQQEHHHD